MFTRRTILLASIAAACGEGTMGADQSSSAEPAQSTAQMATAPELDLGELLPRNQSPLQANVVSDQLVRQAIAVFDQGGSERRWYDRVDQLDGLTIGFGHWPQSRFYPTFLPALRAHNHGATFTRFVSRLAEFYADHPETWARKPIEIGSPTSGNIVQLLDQTLYSATFMARYARNCTHTAQRFCQANSPSFFNEHCSGERDWIGSALEYALRDRAVVLWQLEFWTEDQIDSVRDEAAALGIDDEGGIIVLAHLNSSSPSYVRRLVNGARGGEVTADNFRWDWNTPGGGAPTAALTSWRKLAAWQFYNIAHEDQDGLRSRAVTYFERYLATDWRLPHMRGARPVSRQGLANSDPSQVVWIGSA